MKVRPVALVRIIAAGVGLIAIVVLVVWAVPVWLTRAPKVAAADRFGAIADVRTGLAAIIAAIAAAPGLWYTAKTFRLGQIGQLADRFQNASTMIGDAEETVRLSGLFAMAQLADEWVAQRQTCIDVLCASIRLPRLQAELPDDLEGSDSKEESPRVKRDREIRRTAVLMITDRLRPPTGAAWTGCDFDFTGAQLDVGDFSGIRIHGGRMSFDRVKFKGAIDFSEIEVTDGMLSFRGAEFENPCRVSFDDAKFLGGDVDFADAKFVSGDVDFTRVTFGPLCRATFKDARFGAGGGVRFVEGHLSGGVTFVGAQFGAGAGLSGALGGSDREVRNREMKFERTSFSDTVSFAGIRVLRDILFVAPVLNGDLSFVGAQMIAGSIIFSRPEFSETPGISMAGVPPGGGKLVWPSGYGSPRWTFDEDTNRDSLVVDGGRSTVAMDTVALVPRGAPLEGAP